MPKRLAQEEFCKKFYEIYSEDDFEIVSDYINRYTKLNIRCKHCGKIYPKSPAVLFNRDTNFQCDCQREWASWSRLTHEQYCQKVYARYGDKFTVISEYTGHDCNMKIRHNECGHIFDRIASRLTSKQCNVQCPCEYGRNFDKDINSIAVVDPEFAKLFLNEEDTWKYTCNSNVKTDFVCPYCNSIIYNKTISQIYNRGLSCHRCGDGSSFFEKLISAILDDNISKIDGHKYKYDRTQAWSNKYRYDFFFYINSVPYIIETHGRQHYFKSNNTDKFKILLEEQQKIDKEKFELAVANGVNSENYIVINCSNDDFDFLKNNILNSKMSDLFNLKLLDVNKSFIRSMKSRMIKVCDMWNSGEHSPTVISEQLGIDRGTVMTYLKNGTNIGYCNYIPIKEYMKKIRCKNYDLIFESIAKAAEYCGLKSSSPIVAVCKGKRKTAGKHPTTGEPLLWEYV